MSSPLSTVSIALSSLVTYGFLVSLGFFRKGSEPSDNTFFCCFSRISRLMGLYSIALATKMTSNKVGVTTFQIHVQ